MPVPGFCRYEANPDILGYPYLVIGGLPGAEGRAAFEAACDGDRCDMLRQFGGITALIHLVSPAAWPVLLNRVFQFDVSVCPHCGGRMRFVAALRDPHSMRT